MGHKNQYKIELFLSKIYNLGDINEEQYLITNRIINAMGF